MSINFIKTLQQYATQSLAGLMLLTNAQSSLADTTALDLPLVSKNGFIYAGSFRVQGGTLGESSAASAKGTITLGSGGNSIYMAGHPRDHAIAEFSIPMIVNSKNVADLNIAPVIQPFAKVLERPTTGNVQGLNRIGGMEYIDGELIINTYQYYDADQNTTHTTLVVEDAANLAGATINGYHGYEAKAHASGWISPIPNNLKTILGGTHITGHSSGPPITNRFSVGPSAFVINPSQYILNGKAPTTIPTSTLLDFSLSNILGDANDDGRNYLFNETKTNDLWTYASGAVYGFIVPGTRSYVTLGQSGGHVGGIGYKITQDDGTLCGGYCTYIKSDVYNHFWLWDINDLLDVKNGLSKPHEILPYSYGVFDTPFQETEHRGIVGGAFDSSKMTLYLTLKSADWTGGKYDPLPVIAVYTLPPIPSAPDLSVK